ncbi:hypothetical protein GQX74_010747 [Glossina fuscipes]|nr:hypothetical protein GQX74_010747 [Glossina fuscipes]
MPFGRKSPLEALALPGVILAYKYSQFRQRRREAASRRVTERELSALHHKIMLYVGHNKEKQQIVIRSIIKHSRRTQTIVFSAQGIIFKSLYTNRAQITKYSGEEIPFQLKFLYS